MATAAQQLAELLQRQGRLEARADEIAAEERAAHAAVQQASADLVALERTAASGTKVSAARRTEMENALLQAKSTAAAPWQERRAAAQLVVEDVRLEVSRFVGANLDALLAELEEQGQEAAAAVDAAAQSVLDAFARRMNVEASVFALLSHIGRVLPGDVQRTQAEPLAAAAGRLLELGGEMAPHVSRRPDQPRHGGQPVDEAVPA